MSVTLVTPSSLSQRGAAPNISARVCCGQTAGRIKMPLGREVGLSPVDTVLDGDPAPVLEKGHNSPPRFGPCLMWPNGSIDQDATWCGGWPWLRPHCVRWGTQLPLKKAQPHFSAHVCCGQTVADSAVHLFNYTLRNGTFQS